MDSSQEDVIARPLKRPREGFVTLAEDLEAVDEPDQAIFVGHRIRSDVAAQSGLLAGLAEADGLASLPEDISPQDVQLWQVARRTCVAPSTDELVTIMKVLSFAST